MQYTANLAAFVTAAISNTQVVVQGSRMSVGMLLHCWVEGSSNAVGWGGISDGVGAASIMYTVHDI